MLGEVLFHHNARSKEVDQHSRITSHEILSLDNDSFCILF